ncbi:hypothetical protein RJ640_014180 [Escallonia rubra]|uniref:HAT C-terminal dimerisation domain-containing protein n=1 Tax=Escallonia rubra TaxID=112253 RepID=A0AA88U9I9_9ASTE|nr:hypothetical protein RJ640_014180 [Escallonia rubra]
MEIMKSINPSSSSLPQHDKNSGNEEHDHSSLGFCQQTISAMVNKRKKEVADSALVKRMIVNNIAFNVLRNEEFRMACMRMAEHGVGSVPPSSETARTKILSCLKDEASDYVKSIMESWAETGYIDGLLEVNQVMETARKIVKFMYKYQDVLDLMKVHTGGRELNRPGVLQEEEALRYLVASAEWRNMTHCKSEDKKEVTEMIQGKTLFGKRGMRMVDGEGSIIGYLYKAINKANECINEFYKEENEEFMMFWKIIDGRRNKNMHSDLFMAAAVLSPCLFYSRREAMDKEIKPALEGVIQDMIPNFKDRKIIVSELLQYVARKPNIFTELELFGAKIPKLQKLAIKILSQPSSASACERNWSAFEAAHSKKRNHLERKKLHDLAYMRMNMHMKKRSSQNEMKNTAPISRGSINAYALEEDELWKMVYQLVEHHHLRRMKRLPSYFGIGR